MKDGARLVYERVLILRCQTGDETALTELVELYSPKLRLFLRKMTADAALADDLLQDTWFEAYRKINRLQRLDAFQAWIYRIARDKVYRELRRKRLDLLTDEHLLDSAAAEDDAFAQEEIDSIRDALDRLHPEHREVLVLRFVQAMSYEQIAQIIARPLGTVRSRIHYAKLAMRKLIETAKGSGS